MSEGPSDIERLQQCQNPQGEKYSPILAFEVEIHRWKWWRWNRDGRPQGQQEWGNADGWQKTNDACKEFIASLNKRFHNQKLNNGKDFRTRKELMKVVLSLQTCATDFWDICNITKTQRCYPESFDETELRKLKNNKDNGPPDEKYNAGDWAKLQAFLIRCNVYGKRVLSDLRKVRKQLNSDCIPLMVDSSCFGDMFV